MRKIILNLAMSLDGYIVDEKGGYEWIEGDGDKSLNTAETHNFPKFIESIDIVVMGSKSYEDIGIEDYPDKKIIVATSREMENYDNVEFVNNDIVGYVQALQKEDGKDIWLFGGSGLTDNFMKEDVVDEFHVGMVPIILGGGRPLFFSDRPTVKLHLDKYTIEEGLPLLVYSRR
ncbi:dihydrofolate reductase family protein [Bacillus sp. 2205SS5-2]|uniref:dihydrofolate reductase family protein n=1 Tax=Bacillus sp. 2205SS5-2 TaxID=3109031 RepID=UPI003004EF41